MWSRCSFSVTSKHSTLPSRARAAMTETSRSKAMKPSRMQGAFLQAAPGGRGVAALRDLGLALAVVAELPRLQHRRQAERAIASASCVALCTGA